MDREQHFTTNLEKLEKCVPKYLNNDTILEIGAGTGALTKILLKRGAQVVAYEIEPGLCKVQHPYLDLREEDATKFDLGQVHWKNTFHVWTGIISNPPYKLLPMIKKLIEDYVVCNVILMVPERALPDFRGFEVVEEFVGTDFTPPSKGKHFVIRHGW